MTSPHKKIPLRHTELGNKANALEQLDDVFSRLREVSRVVAAASGGKLTWLHVFGMTASVRAIGIHTAIRDTIEGDNPHATFSLLRTYLEIGAVACYVVDHPSYAKVLASRQDRGEKSPKRVSSQAIVNAAAPRYPGIKAAWDELSEVSHVGSPAFWMPWVIESEADRLTTIASWPRWRDQNDALMASMYGIEFGTMVETELVRLVADHLQREPHDFEVIATTSFTQGF